MSDIRRLRQQIDACRVHSDDLDLPELADLARAARTDQAVAQELDRSQRFDRAAIAAVHDVPVPDGLLGRLLAAAGASQGAAIQPALQSGAGIMQAMDASSGVVDGPIAEGSAPAAPALPAKAGWSSRRGWLAVAGSIAAACLIGVTIWMTQAGAPAPTLSKDQLASSVMHWMDDMAAPGDWKSAAVTSPPAAFKVDPAVQQKVVRWRYYRTPQGAAVVYDLSPPGRPRALLFVVRTSARYSVLSLPYTQLTASRGTVIGAWQKPDLLYVLVVDEDGQRLDDVVRKPHVT
jgi:hypothetical protein